MSTLRQCGKACLEEFATVSEPLDLTGNIDASAIFQRAIDALQGSDATLCLPAGKIKIDNKLVISQPLKITGAGMKTSVLIGNVPDDFVIQCEANLSHMEDFSVGNPIGSGIHWAGAFKSSAERIWCGIGVRDVAFFNNGCQQLHWSNMWSTVNGTRPIESGLIAKFGFLLNSFAHYGSSAIDVLALAGKQLLLGRADGSGTHSAIDVPASVTSIDELIDAINLVTSETGLVAIKRGSATQPRIALFPIPLFDSLGNIKTHDSSGVALPLDDPTYTGVAGMSRALVLENSTGDWSNAGFVRGKFESRYGTDAGRFTVNSSVVEFCHAEGNRWWGLANETYDRGGGGSDIFLDNNTLQGNGNPPQVPSEPIQRGNIAMIKVSGGKIGPVHLEAGGIGLLMKECRSIGVHGGQLSTMEMESSRAISFVGSSIGPGLIDAACDTIFLQGCSFDRGGNSGGLKIESHDVRYSGSIGNTPGAVQRRNADNSGTGRILNVNGRFDHWHDDDSLPVGPWRINDLNKGVVSREKTDFVSGSSSMRIQTNANLNGPGSTFLEYELDNEDLTNAFGTACHSSICVSYDWKRLAGTEEVPWAFVRFPGLTGGEGTTWITMRMQPNALNNVFPQDEWTRIHYSARLPDISGLTGNVYLQFGAGTTQGSVALMDNLVIALGRVTPNAWESSHGEAKQILIDGCWHDMGTAPPQAGRFNLKGSRRRNTAPVMGEPTEWICTASGDPGIWAPLNILV